MGQSKKITLNFVSLGAANLYSQIEDLKLHRWSTACSNHNYVVDFQLGSAAKFGTASYWIYQWHTNPQLIKKTGRTLSHETLACLLGGFGITGELSLAYFEKINREVRDIESLDAKTIEDILRSPVFINGKLVKYRYPKQKAKYIAAALKETPKIEELNLPPLELRNRLMEISGIGAKTASWIVRNYTGSDQVAIIDIHLHRAGVLAGLFRPEWNPNKHYQIMEDIFLKFSHSFSLSPGGLDLLIWNHMRIRKFTPSHLSN